MFQGLRELSVDNTYGLIRWDNNWTTFIDAMLQIKILQNDTRSVFLPVFIKKLVLEPEKHLENVGKCPRKDGTILVSVHAPKEHNIVR